MRTIVSNEKAVWQKADERGHVLSVIQSGSLYRFVIETMAVQPEENGLDPYRFPKELHRSGLYDGQQLAQNAALGFRL